MKKIRHRGAKSRYRILVSAIACSPSGGSEGGVGWAAILRLSRFHDVRVLTAAAQEADWNLAFERGDVPSNVEVRFLGVPTAWHPQRFIARMQSWQRFVRFNRLVLAAALEWHAEEPMDLVHQITYATWRVPSPLWQMPIPFVWGPVGGVAEIPPPFKSMLSLQARSLEWVRGLQSRWARASKGYRDCVTRAAVVLAANEETDDFLRADREGKSMFRLPVAYVSPTKVSDYQCRSEREILEKLTLFAGGNIEGRKGVGLALRALARVRDAGVDFHYTVAGGGPEIGNLKVLTKALGLESAVTFHPGYRGDEYVSKLQAADIYLLPSFRETTPVTLQEAILAGCYPIVADASAAGEMVRLVGGSAVPTESREQVVADLASEIILVAGDRERMQSVAAEASRRVAGCYSAENYDAVIAEAYELAMSAGPWADS